MTTCRRIGLVPFRPHTRRVAGTAAATIAVVALAASVAMAQRFRGGGFGRPAQLSSEDDYRGTFQFCRLVFRQSPTGDGGGWGVDWPRADENLSIRLSELTKTPVWIRGIDHRIEPMALGLRDLTVSASTRIAAERAGVGDGSVDVAELHAPFTHQELILRAAIGLGDSADINPSGGALAANPMLAAGLIRIGEVATRIAGGQANRGVAHATSGPCLQQNLVCILEGSR